MIANEPDVANPGIIRPPLVYLVSILFGIILNQTVALNLPVEYASKYVGGLILFSALVLFAQTREQFKLANTPIPGNRKTTSLIISGPFAFSRNPIYLVFTLIQISVAIFLQNGWILIVLVIPMVIMSWVVIPREESYMARKFGPDFEAYKSKVRRWI